MGVVISGIGGIPKDDRKSTQAVSGNLQFSIGISPSNNLGQYASGASDWSRAWSNLGICSGTYEPDQPKAKPLFYASEPILPKPLDFAPPMNAPKPLFDPSAQIGLPETKVGKPLFEKSIPAAKIPPGPRPMFTQAKIRKRLDVKIEDLASYKGSPTAKARALIQILQLDVEAISTEYVLAWGADVQEAHQYVLNILLDSALHDFSYAKRVIGEIVELLSSIDIADINKNGFFARSKETKISRANAVLSKIKEKSYEAANQIGFLKNTRDKMAVLKARIDAVEEALDPYLISCDFFVNLPALAVDAKAGLFVARLSSLTQTKLTLEHNRQQRAALEANVVALIQAIQGTIQGDIPMWQSNYITCLTSGANSVTLAQTHSNLINQLKAVTQ
jgi:hypothetical protein